MSLIHGSRRISLLNLLLNAYTLTLIHSDSMSARRIKFNLLYGPQVCGTTLCDSLPPFFRCRSASQYFVSLRLFSHAYLCTLSSLRLDFLVLFAAPCENHQVEAEGAYTIRKRGKNGEREGTRRESETGVELPVST